MARTSYPERLARHLGRDVIAACAARPRNTTITLAVCGGAGAAIGSIAGGSPLFAGIGGGLGALLAYLVVWLRIRGSGQSVSMALVLDADRLELLRLGIIGLRPTGTIRAIPLADIAAVETEDKLLEIRVRIRSAGDDIVVDTGKRGIGAAETAIYELQRRIGT
jgi:hypothetical protein